MPFWEIENCFVLEVNNWKGVVIQVQIHFLHIYTESFEAQISRAKREDLLKKWFHRWEIIPYCHAS